MITGAHDSNLIVIALSATFLIFIHTNTALLCVGNHHLPAQSVINMTTPHSAFDCRWIVAGKNCKFCEKLVIAISWRMVSVHPLAPTALWNWIIGALKPDLIIFARTLLLSIGTIASFFGIRDYRLGRGIIKVIFLSRFDSALDSRWILTNATFFKKDDFLIISISPRVVSIQPRAPAHMWIAWLSQNKTDQNNWNE